MQRCGQQQLGALCLALTASSVAAQAPPREIRVSPHTIVDYEFDRGRDGTSCPSCNGGAGNARLAFVDADHKLWTAKVDIATGNFAPANGQGTLIDANAATANEIGNGPEWMVSQRGSELVYTRWLDGLPQRATNLVVGYAHFDEGAWVAGPLAGGAKGRVLPVGSMDAADKIPAIHYQSVSGSGRPASLFWRSLRAGAAEAGIPIASNDPSMTRRWVPGSRSIIITAPAAPDAQGQVFKQVFLFDTASGAIAQLTTDPADKLWAFMWKAPEYENEYLFFVVSGGDHLNVYRDLPAGDGTHQWTVIHSLAMPAATPWVSSPEPFVHNGRSWVFFTLSANPDLHDLGAASLLAMTGIVPDTSGIRMLTPADAPARARRDPEYYITANGPYLYYNRYRPATATSPQASEGVFRVDTGLGPRQP
jgi:hypothetical protein